MPPDADGEYVWRMEGVIRTYLQPYDARQPVVCFNEASRQLFGAVREAQPASQGKRAKVDCEYERKGTCNLFVMCEPLRGWRHVRVTDRRTRRDYAECVKELMDVHYPEAEKIRLVQDNLNTHSGGSLHERLAPAEALRILDKVEFHDTPKHGSWLNRAETGDRHRESAVPEPPPGLPNEAGPGGGGLGDEEEREEGSHPLDLHSGRRPPETWEYACRDVSVTSRSYGSAEAMLCHHTWFSGNAQSRAWPVGQKKPNVFGLFDRHANAWEWCQNGYTAYKPGMGGKPAED